MNGVFYFSEISISEKIGGGFYFSGKSLEKIAGGFYLRGGVLFSIARYMIVQNKQFLKISEDQLYGRTTIW